MSLMQISPRLLPGVSIGDTWIQVEPLDTTNSDGKPAWRITIDIPGQDEYVDESLHGWGNAREMMSSTLSFLGACAEARSFNTRCPQYAPSENTDLFPDRVAEWAEQNSDEITMTQVELDEETD